MNGFTRSITLSSSLHFNSLQKFIAAGNGIPTLPGQTAQYLDNGYGLQGNPTLHALQATISDLEKGRYTLLYPSGLTALLAIEAIIKSGDHWLLPNNCYGPLRRFAQYQYEHYGIAYDLYETNSLESIKKNIKEQTKLIHIENPSSITFALSDVDGIVKIAKSKNILTSADNTWAGGLLYHPLDHGVDINLLSLTKYPAGYSDVFMGSLTTKNKDLFQKFAYHHRVHGYTVSPFSAMLVQRGLESLSIRLKSHEEHAKQLINVLKKRKKITKIYSVDTEKAKEFSGSNGLFSIELDCVYTDQELEKVFSALSVFHIGESWGGTKSMIMRYQPENLSKHTIIRFHAGLDDIEKQKKDVLKLLEKYR